MPPAKLDAELIVRSEFLKLLPDDQQGDIDNVPLADLGIDSLDFFEKLLLLDEEHGIRIAIEELDNDVTLGDILSSLEAGT